MQLDLSINLTTIVGIIVWLVTLAIAWTKFGGRIDMLELRVSNIEKAMEKIANSLETFQNNEKMLLLMEQQVATVQKQHAALNETVEMLRRGEGWITGPRRHSVEGEYPNPAVR